MNTCQVCGETKHNQAFIKIKHFKFMMKKKVTWCRDCQRMFMEMKTFEKAKEELSKKLTGVIEFL